MKSVRPLRQAAGGLLAITMVFAPLAFGGIPPWSLVAVEAMLGVAVLLWVLDLAVTRTPPRLPATVVLCAAWLMGQGWFMVWNAHGAYSTITQFILPIASPLPSAPGAMERGVALAAMVRVSALLGALLMLTDLMRETPWSLRLLWTAVWTGTAFSLFGLVQRAGMVHFVADRMDSYEGIYFSTYNYHANAGAYLNLILPAVVVLLFVALSERGAAGRRILLGLLLGCCLLAALLNTSRGAQAVTALLLVGLLIWAARVLAFGQHPTARLARRALAVSVFVCAGLGLILVPHLHALDQKWRHLPQEITGESGRTEVWPIARAMARKSGPLGEGPGSFKMLLPRSPLLSRAFYSHWVIQRPVPGAAVSMWSQAHEDYLQTVIEFGWVGGVAAGMLLFGGILRAWRSLRADRVHPVSQNRILNLGAMSALLGVAIHSAFDFPLQVISLQLYAAVYLAMAWSSAPSDPVTETAAAAGEPAPRREGTVEADPVAGVAA